MPFSIATVKFDRQPSPRPALRSRFFIGYALFCLDLSNRRGDTSSRLVIDRSTCKRSRSSASKRQRLTIPKTIAKNPRFHKIVTILPINTQTYYTRTNSLQTCFLNNDGCFGRVPMRNILENRNCKLHSKFTA